MGGFGSGNSTGRPTADASCKIDLAWMIRERWAIPGTYKYGTLHWTCGGEPSGSISYFADMTECNNSKLILSYTRGTDEEKESVRQEIRLTYTEPHYGGRRWWMICPYRGIRVGKLYLPCGGDRFASRKAWRLAYQSQRSSHHDRPFDRLFRLQKKLGGTQGWEAGLAPKPKGMWHRTYEDMWQKYYELDEQCAAYMIGWMARLSPR